MSYGFDAVSGHNLTFIICQHIPRWWWSACMCVNWLNGTISLALDEQFVRFAFVCLSLLVLLGFVQCAFIISPHSPAKCYTGDGRRLLSWLNRRNDVVAQIVRSCYCGSIQCYVIILPSFAVKMFYNGDDCSTFIWVELTKQSRWLRMNRRYVRSLMFDFEGVIGGLIQCTVMIASSSRVKICSNYNVRRTFILVESTERFRWPRTTSLYVRITVCLTLEMLFGFDAVQGHNATPIHCRNILRWRWLPFVCFACIDGTIWATLAAQLVRLKMLVAFDPVWRLNFTLTPCQKLLWEWSVFARLKRSRWPWTNRMYVCIPVLNFFNCYLRWIHSMKS